MCYVEPSTTITTTSTSLRTKTTVGTCSRCGGRVSVPSYWMGLNYPDPTCERCGAVSFGPVIDMGPPCYPSKPTSVPVYPVIPHYEITEDPPHPRGRKVREGRGWD